jgi:hypothetical protein
MEGSNPLNISKLIKRKGAKVEVINLSYAVSVNNDVKHALQNINFCVNAGNMAAIMVRIKLNDIYFKMQCTFKVKHTLHCTFKLFLGAFRCWKKVKIYRLKLFKMLTNVNILSLF